MGLEDFGRLGAIPKLEDRKTSDILNHKSTQRTRSPPDQESYQKRRTYSVGSPQKAVYEVRDAKPV